MEYLLVYRQVRRGKDDRWALCSGRLAPVELVDDLGLAERYGAGYYRVQARGSGGRIIGAAYQVGIPDAEGKVPVQSDDGDGQVARVEGDGGAGALVPMMMEWLKLQQSQFRDEIRRVREDNQANVEAFARINQTTIESLGAINGGPRPGDDDRVSALSRRLDQLSEENVRLRIEAAERRAKRGGGDDEFWGGVLRDVAPKLFELATTRAAERRAAPRPAVVDRVRAAQQRGAARAAPPVEAAAPEDPRPEDPPAVEGEVVDPPPGELPPEEYARRLAVLGWVLPELADVQAAVAEGRLSQKERDWFRVLRDAALLPPAYRDALVSAL